MDAWFVWITVARLFGGAEMLTMDLFPAPFAFGAVALLAGLGAGLGLTPVAFVATALLVFAVRPLVLSHWQVPPRIRTSTAALIGARAVMLDSIGNHRGWLGVDRGRSVRRRRVRAKCASPARTGEVCIARAYEDEVIAEGSIVDIIEIPGATAWVME